MRTVSYIMIGVLSYLLQAIVFPALFHKGWQPDLFLVWVILLTIQEGRRMGLLFAVVAGILRDVVLGNVFGLHILPYVAIVYLVSLVEYDSYREQWYRSVMIVAMATLIDGLLRMVMLSIGFSGVSVLTYIWYYIWPAFMTNSILAVLVHAILWKLSGKEEYVW